MIYRYHVHVLLLPSLQTSKRQQVLLQFRADLDSPCRNGLTPLTGVASLANPETVKERSSRYMCFFLRNLK